MSDFTHLHVHTQYSLLDGAARIPDLVHRAKETGQKSLAITDHGAMYGVIDFYKECKKQGIKPILGMEAYVAPKSRFDRNERENAHLILLAKNQVGYRNLMALSSEAFLHGFYYKPRIDYDLLSGYSEGLICLSACLAGDIPQLLLHGRYEDALLMAHRLQNMFGQDFYIELQNHGIPEQIRILPALRRIASEIGAKCVATNDIHYVLQEDAEAQDVLLCIQTQRFVDDENRMRMGSDQFYLKTEEEMLLALPEDAEAIRNTGEVADKCELEIEFGVRRLPAFTPPSGIKNSDYLRNLCWDGFERKLSGEGNEAKERLEYELGIVEQMGFVDYFLIVWDFIHFAKSNGIMVGPGRGSGAGSLAAYCLDITDVNPLKYSLLFERFLNPERISMPDFDVDFCYERRQEVIDYVGRKYGEGHVSQIITFGTMAAKGVIRDVGRALHLPYADVDRLAKMVPNELNITLSRAMSLSLELAQLYQTDETTKKLLDLSLKLEGLPRHSSTHAAGVVISGVPIMEVVPLQKNEEVITTQFPMTTLEELGLLKMDFLGLRTLTVIRDTREFIRKNGKTLSEQAMKDYDDPAVYKMISEGETDGVFQLESAGMRQFLLQLRPDCFEDLIAGISLYRPGPMEQIPRYIQGKHDPKSVCYSTPLLEPILRNTYGCMVYQEQVMEIVRALAGYSYGRSDLVRRAMAKKKHDVMAKEREYFVHGTEGVVGAVKNGVPEQVANRIFDEMMDFASYAFNKSHAAAYAVLAYQTAYLRHYYPVEFFTALINSYMGNISSVATYVYTARRIGIPVLPPDVNRSMARFSVEGEAIRFGMAAVKNVSVTVMENMTKEREKEGEFKNFFDFCDRVEGLNKRMVEQLICAGCFDSMGGTRAQYISVTEKAISHANEVRKRKATGQISLFDFGEAAGSETVLTFRLPDVEDWDSMTALMREKEATGLYLSGHPLEHYTKELTRCKWTVLDLQNSDGITGVKDNETVTVGGLLSSCKQKPTKSGNGIMGYAVLEGITGSVECVVFPKVLQQVQNLFHDDSAVLVTGVLNIREDRENSILIQDLSSLSRKDRKVYINIPGLNMEKMKELMLFLQKYPGSDPVIACDGERKLAKAVPEQFTVCSSEDFILAAEQLYGEKQVIVR